jgi:DNA invertase Pin-like site-specific DNA recombinase
VTKPLTLSQLVRSRAIIPAISYGRVSSEKQLRGEGLKRQRKSTFEWIAKHPELRIRLDDEKTDEARSAWKGDHVLKDDAALGKLLEMVKRGDLQPPLLIIVEALDRLSRENPWTAQERLAGLVTRGVFVVTTRDDKIYSLESGVGDLIGSVVLMVSAHEESQTKSHRVRETKALRVADAMTTKHVLHKMAPHWLHVADAISSTNRATRRYEVIERHVETVQMMYPMALHHGASYITAWLIKNREPFGRSGRWNTFYVRDILSSRAPIGHLETRHGVIEDIFPKIIDDDLWLRVQAAREARKGGGGHKMSAFVNLFAGLCRCAECGGPMRINTNGRTGYKYYECKDHSSLKNCTNRCRYRVDIIEAAVLDNLDWLTVTPAPSPKPADINQLSEHLIKLQAHEKRLAPRLKELDDDAMFDTVMEQLRELRGDVNDAKTRLTAAQQAIAVAAAPVYIGDLTDRPAVHTALRQRLKGMNFGLNNEVMVVTAGALLMVVARQRQNPDGPRLMIARPDGKMAMVANGKLRITDALMGMPPLDLRTCDELLARIKMLAVAS